MGTSCATKDSVLPVVHSPSIPGHVALYRGRYIRAKGFSCSWGEPPTPPPRVSVLVAKHSIWIGLSYDDWESVPEEAWVPYMDSSRVPGEVPLSFDEIGYFPSQLGPSDQRWIIPNQDGRHDWAAARNTLLELHELVVKEEQEAALAASAASAASAQGDLAGVFWQAPSETYSMEIAAEDEVPYESVLAAIDLAVAAEFEDFAYVDTWVLPEWLKE